MEESGVCGIDEDKLFSNILLLFKEKVDEEKSIIFFEEKVVVDEII